MPSSDQKSETALLCGLGFFSGCFGLFGFFNLRRTDLLFSISTEK